MMENSDRAGSPVALTNGVQGRQGKVPMPEKDSSREPLAHLDEWEDFLKDCYPPESQPETHDSKPFVATDPNKKAGEFRDYRAEARSSVKEFYLLNHTRQTLDFVRGKKQEYLSASRRSMRWSMTATRIPICLRSSMISRPPRPSARPAIPAGSF